MISDHFQFPASGIISRYCRITGTGWHDLCSPSKSSPIARRRHELMYLLRQMTALSQAEIGRLFGGRDPSTVQAAVEGIADRIVADRAFADRLREIAMTIRGVSQAPARANEPTDVMHLAALGVLRDASLSDADARHAALVLLSRQPTEARHGL